MLKDSTFLSRCDNNQLGFSGPTESWLTYQSCFEYKRCTSSLPLFQRVKHVSGDNVLLQSNVRLKKDIVARKRFRNNQLRASACLTRWRRGRSLCIVCTRNNLDIIEMNDNTGITALRGQFLASHNTNANIAQGCLLRLTPLAVQPSYLYAT